MREMDISKGWHTLQDVYDSGEKLNIYQENWDPTTAYLQVTHSTILLTLQGILSI